MAEKRPDRVLGPNHDTFWEYCDKKEFRLQKCDRCGAVQFPPSPACPGCLSLEMTWTSMKGTGTIVSHTTCPPHTGAPKRWQPAPVTGRTGQ